jgi:hypothetical protein
MSRDRHPALRDVTGDTERTTSSIVVCWTVFSELLPGKALMKSVTLWIFVYLFYKIRENILFDKKNRSRNFDGFAAFQLSLSSLPPNTNKWFLECLSPAFISVCCVCAPR